MEGLFVVGDNTNKGKRLIQQINLPHLVPLNYLLLSSPAYRI